MMERHPSRGVNCAGQTSTTRSASLVANALLCLLLIFATTTLWLPARKALRRATATVSRTEALLSRLHQGMNVTGVHLEAATSKLDRGKDVARHIQSSIDQYQEALKSLTANAETGSEGHLQPILEEYSNKIWLTVGIPTVTRKNEADYLSKTLESLLEELPMDATDPLYAKVRVVVMNNQPGNHSVFYQLQQRILKAQTNDSFVVKARIYVDLLENPGTLTDPMPHTDDPNDLDNPSNRPGRQVRKQTCDLITLLEMCEPLSHYYLFMEDDFRSCPNAVRIMHYIVAKLNAAPETQNWLSVRLSYGMNGILLSNAHLKSLTDFLRVHTARLPPDLLYVEWLQGFRTNKSDSTTGKIQYVYHKNLLDHMGELSSFSVRPDRLPFPGCFHSMSDIWSLSAAERFQAEACPSNDLSPCPVIIKSETWTRSPIQWPSKDDDVERYHTGANVSTSHS